MQNAAAALDPAEHIRLSAVRLPADAPLARAMPLPEHKRDERYIARFDARTLIYDAYRPEGGAAVEMVCPRLLNLWPALRDGLRADGRPVRIRRRVYRRWELLRIDRPAGPLTIEIAGTTLPVPVGEDLGALFAGRNCLITQQKDTPPEWIEDWLRFHVSAHGVDAALIYDNGEGDHAALQARLSAVPGLAVCRVVPTPFPYGDKAGGKFYVPTKFLQTAVLNLARLRFLPRARGVLSLDIDEFLRPAPESVFDRVVRSRLGVVSFDGRWVHSDVPGPQPQRAHGFTRAKARVGNPKWCARPGFRAARLSWAVHRPAGPFFPLSMTRDFGYWHFHATSTSWKHLREQPPGDLVPDPELTAALARHLPQA